MARRHLAKRSRLTSTVISLANPGARAFSSDSKS